MTALRHRLISFDLDGTLVDTAAEIAEAANLALETHGIARRAPEQIALLIGAGTGELMRKLLAQVLRAEPALADRLSVAAVLASMDHHYAATTGTSARPYAGCIAWLTALRDAGLRLACVTNKESRHAHRVLQMTGLDCFFELVIGGDTLPQKKPHASVLQHVAEVLACELDEIAHVGDSSIDVDAARNAGVAAWAVSYGYNAGRPIAEARPQRIFDSLPEVARHVLSGADFEPRLVAAASDMAAR